MIVHLTNPHFPTFGQLALCGRSNIYHKLNATPDVAKITCRECKSVYKDKKESVIREFRRTVDSAMSLKLFSPEEVKSMFNEVWDEFLVKNVMGE